MLAVFIDLNKGILCDIAPNYGSVPFIPSIRCTGDKNTTQAFHFVEYARLHYTTMFLYIYCKS